MTAIFQAASVETIQDHLNSIMGWSNDLWHPKGSSYGTYSYCLLGPKKAKLCWSSDRSDVLVELPGATCSLVGTERLLKWIGYCSESGANFTRVDPYYDDPERVLEPRQAHDLIDSDSCVTRITTLNWHETKKRGRSKRTGSSAVLGADSSPTRLTVYDKSYESRGEVNAIRWELRLRKDYAKQFVNDLLGTNDLVQTYFSHLTRVVDFREPTGTRKHTERWSRAAWWDAFVRGAQKARIVIEQVARTPAQVVSWFRKNIAPSLALVRDLVGLDELMRMADEGRTRWKARHWLVARMALE